MGRVISQAVPEAMGAAVTGHRPGVLGGAGVQRPPQQLAGMVESDGRIHGHIDELFAQDRPLPEILEEVARLGAQLLMQAALEAEVTEFLGRDRYAGAALAEDARPGSRNGYREVTVKMTAGPAALARPKLRGTTEAFASRLFGSHVTKTNALESLVIASFIRGLSVRDVEATLAGENTWRRLGAPALAVLMLATIAVLAVQHYATLLGVLPGDPAAWVLPGCYGVVAAAGLGWALVLKTRRPQIYAAIGLGPHAVIAQHAYARDTQWPRPVPEPR